MIDACKEFYRHLSARDRRLVFWVIVGALFLSSLPYIVGWIVAGRSYSYLGLYPLGSADTNVYFSFMKQAEQGKVFVENLHTGELQHGSIFHPLWLVLGWSAGLFRLPIPLVFHLARVILGAVFLLFLYFFLGSVFSDSRRRNIAFVLAAFASGIGVFFSINVPFWDTIQAFLLLPSDQWITESNTFLTLMHSPLFLLSQLLLLLLFWLVLHEERLRGAFMLGVVAFALGLVHPYDLVTVAALLPAFLAVRRIRDPMLTPRDAGRFLRRLAVIALFVTPAIIYFSVIGRVEPAIGGWMRQNVTISPMPHSYIFGYGLILAFAVAGFVALRKTRNRTQLFVLTWTVVGLLLLYIPVQINRRFTNGLHVPLVILAAVGVDLAWRGLSRIAARHELRRSALLSFAGWVVGIGIFFSTMTVVAKSIYWESNPALSIYHLPKTVTTAMDWLEPNTSDADVILAHSYDGNIIPARTGRRVYVGHGHQTVDWDRKRELVASWFFRTNGDDDAKAAFLRLERISVIFFSGTEDRLGEFDPAQKPYLRLVFRNAGASIYRVLAPQEP